MSNFSNHLHKHDFPGLKPDFACSRIHSLEGKKPKKPTPQHTNKQI